MKNPFRGRPRAMVSPRVRARRRLIASGTAVAVISGTLLVLALKYDGAPIHDVDLNDGGVWVSNSNRQMMARLNSQIQELDLGVMTSANSRSIFQEASSVQAFDNGGGTSDSTFFVTDVLRGQTLPPLALPGSFEVSANRDTVAVLDNETGRVWIRRADQLEGFNDTLPADTDVAERSGVVVTTSGTALVADRKKGVVTSWRLDAGGRPVAGRTFDFETEFLDDVVLSAVGEVPVALQAGKLLRAGEDPVAVPGEKPALQQPGPEAGQVFVASDEGVYGAGRGGGDLSRLPGPKVDGRPAAPVVVDDCVHAAWADPGTDNYFRSCPDDDTFKGEIPALAPESDLVFRSNRDVVVLNDTANGNAWMVQTAGLTLVNNWDSVDPNAKDQQIAEVTEKKQTKSRNKPPTAKPDTFGARPGATVILPVTLNDIDPDGDLLVITRPPAMKGETTFSVVGDGTQIQARVSPNAKGTIAFDYEITDGRPQHTPSKAKVTLKVLDKGTDNKPEKIDNQENRLRVADGHQASTNVLPAWIDPEGDSVVLVSAKSDGGEVGFRPDGTIDFTDDGKGTGKETIDFVVRGGKGEAPGSVEVTVVDPRKAEPVAVADHFTGVVNSDILLEPLRNDTDPLGGQLTVPRMAVVAGGAAQLDRDTQRGTGTFRATRAGSYYLEYDAVGANGVSTEPQLIRVDVAPLSGNNRAPVATRDIATVGADGTALVDVLANDSDPDGDVLVVQGIEVPAEWADRVTASLINKRFVRVELTGDPGDAHPQFDYLLSDGSSDQVRGTVQVTRGEAGKNRRPLAVEDIVPARAGTIIEVPVLDNDEDPDGDKITVYQQDLFDIDPENPIVGNKSVPIVASGSSIRVMVPDDGTTQLQIGYGARDPLQARADSRLVLNIKPDSPKGNRAPRPNPIEDRTVSGQRIRVPVNVFGADPDGDPVVFTGVAQPPRYGRIVRSGTNWFEYEPFDTEGNTGTDSFKVQVADAYGATGVAQVRIGVAPRNTENQTPAALDDSLFVKPGLTIQYPVMDNDSDPDGDPLILEAEKLEVPKGTTAKVVGTFVEAAVPELKGRSESSAVAQYSVTDGLGISATATLTVVGRADAPDHAPTTQDDVVSAQQLEGKEAGDTVDVKVLANDGDIDGAKADLELSALAPKASEVVGRELRVTLAKDSQVIPYRITDATKQSSFGFVFVTGTDNMPPMLNTATVPVKVVAGEPETIDLKDVVVVRPGRSPKIARTDRIREANGDAVPKGAGTLEFKAPADYFGPASITLDVLDGKDLNDPESLMSQITIPITVAPAGNVPPTVRSTTVVVAAGGEASTVDLDRLATDPNEDDKLDFEVDGEKDGVSADLKDHVVEISADKGASGGEVVLDVKADDGEADPVTGHIRVLVTATKGEEEVVQPPMTLRELRAPDAEAGKPVTVNVSEAIVFDPFPGTSKKITAKEIESGTASGLSGSGTTLQVTPKAAGDLVIAYKLSDGSGDATRDAKGRVRIVVADVPDAPGKPSALEGGPDSVRLTWNAPADNGKPIDHYLVEWSAGGGGSQKCTATQCVVDGLDSGTEYSFTVKAHNAIDYGKPSPSSVGVKPDKVPGLMNAPVIAATPNDRDGKLHLSWTPPTNEGSDIIGYELASVPATAPRKAGPGDRSLVWDGLVNGTDYTFKIRAVNDRGPGEWSAPSDAQHPFTRPEVMPAPDLKAFNDDGKSGGYLEVSWNAVQAPQNGHDAIASYDVQLLKDGGSPIVVNVTGGTMRAFNVENGHEYSAQVRATNRAGTSEWSSLSASSISWDKASAPTITGSTDCPGGSCKADTSSYTGGVTYSAPADNGGYPVTHYTWETSDGQSGRWDNPDGNGQVRFGGIGSGKTVTITPYTAVPGHPDGVAGTSDTGGNFSPYAKPFPPVQSCGSANGYFAVNVCWSASGKGNGRNVDQTSYTGDASGSDSGSTGSVSIPTAQGGERRCVQARTHTAEGGWSDYTGGMCATSAAREIRARFEAIGGTYGNCTAGNCHWVKFEVWGFRRSHAYTADWNDPDFGNQGFTTDGNGHFRWTRDWWYTGFSNECYAVTVDGARDGRNSFNEAAC